MSATEVSPSPGLESTLLGYNTSPASPPPFAHTPVQNESIDNSTSISHSIDSNPPMDPDQMDHQASPPPNELEEPPPPLPVQETPPQVDGQDHDRMVIDNPESTLPQPNQTQGEPTAVEPPTLPPFSDLLPPPPQVLIAVQSNTQPSNSENPPPPSENLIDISERERSTTESSTDRTQEADDDSDEDEYDGHMEFLNHLKEDETTPSEEEMEEMNRHSSDEKTAHDHGHWETQVYQPLDDPEYIPSESGQITWTLQGFHGTKENPNKKRIMKSPSVNIGGYSWNIKIFPHGFEGTDQVSVYIECNGEATPEDEDEMQTDTAENSNLSQESAEKSTDDVPAEQPVKNSSKPWDVAAQIGCVMYNPNDPRVLAFDKATHHFENASSDWGWVRFYGPWNSLHQRRHLQYRPMLQNDTLAFTAYVRVVKDPTKALWWRPVEPGTWDSITKTGYRGLVADDPDSYSFTAALAPWLHITPFKQLILDAEVADPLRHPGKRPIPLVESLQNVIYTKHSPTGSSHAASLSQVQHAFDWYEHRFDTSTDVIEVWESLRSVINDELLGSFSGQSPDVLNFIATLRQNRHPILPPGSAPEPKLSEPHSVKDILDQAADPDQKIYKDWEGYTSTSAEYRLPDILQVELNRQKYDTHSRKWKKLTHKIKLDEKVEWKGRTYTLFGAIIHKGELGSGRFYSIVRPGGADSKWLRYKSSVTTFLTHRQAIESHEGKGEYREGSESVAHLAIYALSDKLQELVPIPDEDPETAVRGPLKRPEIQPVNLSNSETTIPVIVHNSDIVKECTGTGFVDVWSDQPNYRYHFDISPQSTFKDIQDILVSKFKVAEKPEQCRLWHMKTTTNTVRFLPRLESYAPETKITVLSQFVERLGGTHIWLHVIPVESLEVIETLPPPPPPPSSSQPVPGPPPPPPSNSVPTSQENPSVDTSSDVVMGGTNEPVPNEQSRPDSPIFDLPVETRWQLSNRIYYFVKIFDPKTRSIKGFGGFFSDKSDTVGNAIRSITDESITSESFKVYNEMDVLLEEELSLATKLCDCGGDGFVLVVSPNLPEDAAEEYRKNGEPVTAADHYQCLNFLSHFAYQDNVHVDSYFGGQYTYAPLHHGRFFGQCTMIDDTTGDAYVGNCVNGFKSGQGTMYYANGDTYTGEWANSLPEGQGKMVYNTTGNTYVGGWKAGRRHGKGVMTFEVADEEMQLCKICYENEMNALFYRCGHIAACESCARQVRDCPVCRRAVDAVVRVWKT
jgi:hypothetical protein